MATATMTGKERQQHTVVRWVMKSFPFEHTFCLFLVFNLSFLSLAKNPQKLGGCPQKTLIIYVLKSFAQPLSNGKIQNISFAADRLSDTKN